MTGLSIRSSSTNQRRHRACLDESQLRAVLAKAVADQLSLNLNNPHVTVEVHIRSNYGSIGPTCYHAEVEIVENFSPGAQEG